MPRYSRQDWKVYKNVFDTFTLTNLMKLQAQGHYDELLSPITLGKEANVFTARKGDDIVIVKIYRWMNCNFNKMHEYLVQDRRYQDIKNHKRRVVLSWVQREYANLHIAREYIHVPTPHTVRDNVIVMDFIGHDVTASPMLKDHTPKDPQAFYNKVRANMDKLKAGGLVHGDLSAFNILIHNEEPVFIDFSQATTADSIRAQDLYERDLENINTYFKKLKVKTRA
jgi:RIO kinase 1